MRKADRSLMKYGRGAQLALFSHSFPLNKVLQCCAAQLEGNIAKLAVTFLQKSNVSVNVCFEKEL